VRTFQGKFSNPGSDLTLPGGGRSSKTRGRHSTTGAELIDKYV
jgi:hypothetical protein